MLAATEQRGSVAVPNSLPRLCLPPSGADTRIILSPEFHPMTATARFIDGRRQSPRDQGRVLLVTDDPRVSAYGAGLEERGFHVAGVAGGVKALVALQRTRPHVVVADAAVRGVSAPELAHMLSDAQEPVPIILAEIGRAHV